MARHKKNHTPKKSRSNYSFYLYSPHWQRVKKNYRNSDMPQYCISCNKKYTTLHHRTYKYLFKDRFSDMFPLCKKCHIMLHEFLKNKKMRVEESYKALKIINGWSEDKSKEVFKPFAINTARIVLYIKSKYKKKKYTEAKNLITGLTDTEFLDKLFGGNKIQNLTILCQAIFLAFHSKDQAWYPP